MQTRLIDIRTDRTTAMNEAKKLILDGQVVAIPTETVYGLAANALNAEAVKKIYAAKGRPSDNPLIVHISDYSQLLPLVNDIPEKAKLMAKAVSLVERCEGVYAVKVVHDGKVTLHKLKKLRKKLYRLREEEFI